MHGLKFRQPGNEAINDRVLPSLITELSVPLSESFEMKALKTHEWVQRSAYTHQCTVILNAHCTLQFFRKMICRLTTPDLMFGQMVAPPPVGVASLSETINITDVLSCFTKEGLPTNADLSPIAMVTSHMIT